MTQTARQPHDEAAPSMSTYLRLIDDGLSCLSAAHKSHEIVVRGCWALAWNGAAFMRMGWDDMVLATRVRAADKRFATCLQFERHFLLRQSSLGTQRLATMAKMAREVGEEAQVPIARSLERLLERIEHPHAA